VGEEILYPALEEPGRYRDSTGQVHDGPRLACSQRG
jgi:hypothetical protein